MSLIQNSGFYGTYFPVGGNRHKQVNKSLSNDTALKDLVGCDVDGWMVDGDWWRVGGGVHPYGGWGRLLGTGHCEMGSRYWNQLCEELG